MDGQPVIDLFIFLLISFLANYIPFYKSTKLSVFNFCQRAGDLRSSFCELAHQDVFCKSHDVTPLGGIMGCNPRHDGPPNGGPSPKYTKVLKKQNILLKT